MGKGASVKLPHQLRERGLAGGPPGCPHSGRGAAYRGCGRGGGRWAGSVPHPGRLRGCPPTPAAVPGFPPGPRSSCPGSATTGGRGGSRACAGLRGASAAFRRAAASSPGGSRGSGAGGPARAALSLSRPRRSRGCCSGLRLHCRPRLLPDRRSASPGSPRPRPPPPPRVKEAPGRGSCGCPPALPGGGEELPARRDRPRPSPPPGLGSARRWPCALAPSSRVFSGGQRLRGHPCESRSSPRHGGLANGRPGSGSPPWGTRAARSGHAVVMPCFSPGCSESTPTPKQCSSPSVVIFPQALCVSITYCRDITRS